MPNTKKDALQAVEQAQDWVRTFVIGKDLCPFAAAVEHAGKIRFAAFSQAADAEPLTFALQEAVDLLMTPPADLATTIVVYPTDTCGDFESFLDLATELEGALSAAGADGVLQVATFHPDYVFEGATADDPANATNRSPSPMLHLLREDDVAAAVRAHPNPASIPKRNAALLRREAAEALVSAASS